MFFLHTASTDALLSALVELGPTVSGFADIDRSLRHALCVVAGIGKAEVHADSSHGNADAVSLTTPPQLQSRCPITSGSSPRTVSKIQNTEGEM